MSDILCIYYSRTGTTKKAMEEIASALDAELVELRDAGCGVLLISNELSEILSLSDRIMVMYEGKIVGETTSAQADITRLGLWMAGITQEEDKITAAEEKNIAEQPPEQIAENPTDGKGGESA